MSLLLDTSVAIDLRDGGLALDRLDANPDRAMISLVTLIELQGGIYADPRLVSARRAGLAVVLRRADVLPLDEVIVDSYSSILQAIGFSRRKILDRLIAATAIVHDLTLVTMNGNDFYDIPDLQLEVWPSPQ